MRLAAAYALGVTLFIAGISVPARATPSLKNTAQPTYANRTARERATEVAAIAAPLEKQEICAQRTTFQAALTSTTGNETYRGAYSAISERVFKLREENCKTSQSSYQIKDAIHKACAETFCKEHFGEGTSEYDECRTICRVQRALHEASIQTARAAAETIYQRNQRLAIQVDTTNRCQVKLRRIETLATQNPANAATDLSKSIHEVLHRTATRVGPASGVAR